MAETKSKRQQIESKRKKAKEGPRHKVRDEEKGKVGKALENPWVLLGVIVLIIVLIVGAIVLLSMFLSAQ